MDASRFNHDSNPRLIEDYYAPFVQAIDQLETALFPERLSEMEKNVRERAQFTREHVLKVMKMLVDSPDGFVLKKDVDLEIGSAATDSLVEYNILHMRPAGSKRLAFDIPGAPKTSSILTAMGRPQLRAMKVVWERWVAKGIVSL